MDDSQIDLLEEALPDTYHGRRGYLVEPKRIGMVIQNVIMLIQG